MATARSTASSQLNVRIDSDLKRAGDAVFTSIGLSPSQAVRALWELAANHKDEPERLRAALFPHEEEVSVAAHDKEKARKLKLAAQGPHIMEDVIRASGLNPIDSSVPELSFDDLKELAYQEKYGDGAMFFKAMV